CLLFLKSYLPFISSSYQSATQHTYFQTMLDKGHRGEYQLYRTLEQLSIPKIIFANLYIPREDGTTTEVDLLMVTQYGIFVFEMKNYSGWVFGKENQKYWTQTFPNGKKYKFFNPVWQNQAHVNAVAEWLQIEDKSLVKSWIVFGDKCRLKNVKVTNEDIHISKQHHFLEEIGRAHV